MIPQWIEDSLVNLSVSTPLSSVLGMAGCTPLQGTENFSFVWMRAKSIFLSPRPRYEPRTRYLNTSVEVLTKPRPRVCKALDRGFNKPSVEVSLRPRPRYELGRGPSHVNSFGAKARKWIQTLMTFQLQRLMTPQPSFPPEFLMKLYINIIHTKLTLSFKIA